MPLSGNVTFIGGQASGSTSRVKVSSQVILTLDTSGRTSAPGAYPTPSAEDEAAACFAGSEIMVLESGLTIAISDIKVGDRVQVASTTNDSLEFADVISIPHEMNSQTATFIEIETTNGSSLKSTPSHLVMAGTCGSNNMQFTRAVDVVANACMSTIHGEEAVVSSTEIRGKGIYSVITSHPDGIIVVNGFKASSFAVSHAIPNTYYHIHRILYTYAPDMVKALCGLTAILGSIANSFVAASM